MPGIFQLANLRFHLVIHHGHFVGLEMVLLCNVLKTLLKFPLVFLQEDALVFEALEFPFIVFAFAAIPLIVFLLLVKIIIELGRYFLKLILHSGIILLDFLQEFYGYLNCALGFTIVDLLAGRELFKNLVITFQFLIEVMTSKSYFFKLFMGIKFVVFVFPISLTFTTLIFVFGAQ